MLCCISSIGESNIYFKMVVIAFLLLRDKSFQRNLNVPFLGNIEVFCISLATFERIRAISDFRLYAVGKFCCCRLYRRDSYCYIVRQVVYLSTTGWFLLQRCYFPFLLSLNPIPFISDSTHGGAFGEVYIFVYLRVSVIICHYLSLSASICL